MKGKLFSKFRDYNYILDKMLEEKSFSQDAKNLLLNMIYKIESSYNDYSQIKGVFKSKNEFIDEIIDSVSKYCQNIFLIDPKKEGVLLLRKEKAIAITDEKERKIYAYPTEQAILYGVMEIKPKYFYIQKKYNYFKRQLQRVLVEGSILNSTEVIRNFNGWSWNVVEDENINYVPNMVYQAIRLLLDEEFLEDWEKDQETSIDYILEFRKRIAELYGQNCAKSLYIAMIRLILSDTSNEVHKRLRAEYDRVKKEYEQMSEKNNYIYKISLEKEKFLKEIRKIDLILGDQNKLLNEFRLRNNKLPDDKKMVDASELFKILNHNREKYVKQVNYYNDLVKPINYSKLKAELKEEIEILQILEKNESVRCYAIAFQQEVLKCFSSLLDKIKAKEEIIELIYKMRYYRKLRITSEEKVEDIHSLYTNVKKILEFLVTKACKNKVFNVFYKEPNHNFLIIERALDTTIANYEDVDISLKLQEDGVEVTVYDNEVIEKKEYVNGIFTSKNLNVKQNRHIPMYVF